MTTVDARTNGLGEHRPKGAPGRVLVTGGGGYIGCVLVPKLLARGYEVRVLDTFWFGKHLERELTDAGAECIRGDVRDRYAVGRALDGTEAVIHLAGLSNDPTADFDRQANWDMNTVATERMAHECVQAGVKRFVFSSSCSLYDGTVPGILDETAPIAPRAAYAESKAAAEDELRKLAGQNGFVPVYMRNGTVYGWSPRMRYDLVVNTFLAQALTEGKLLLHGGGWMWRPLVEVRDCADALIFALEAPEYQVIDRVFNVVHSNYQIAELALIVGGLANLGGHPVEFIEAPEPKLTRNYECSNSRLASLGFVPRISVLQSVREMLDRRPSKKELLHPRGYNLEYLIEREYITATDEVLDRVAAGTVGL